MSGIAVTVGFSRPKSGVKRIFSFIIRLLMTIENWVKLRSWEFVPYSHVYVGWHSRGADLDVIYHASGTMLHFLSKEIFDKKAITTHSYKFEMSKENYRKLVRFCMQNAGVDYGKKQLLGIIWVKFVDALGVYVDNPYGDGRKSQVCSELAGYVLEDLLGIKTGLNLDVAGPNDIDHFLRESFDVQS